MKVVSSFTHPQVAPNLYECLCSAEHKGRYSEEWGKQNSSGAPLTSIVFFFPTMEVNGAPKQPGYKLSSKYLPLCSAEQRHSYRFGTTWGWVNDTIFIFGWTVPFKFKISHHNETDLDLHIYLMQCFPNLSWRTPSPAHFVCVPYQTHPIHVLQSLLTSWWVESGVLDKGDIQNVQG